MSGSRWVQHLSCGQLVCANQPAFEQQLLQRSRPDFVVAQRAIVGQRLTSTAAHIEVPCARRAHRKSQREGLSLPGGMEQLLFRLWDNSAIPVLSAQVCMGL